MILCIVGDVEPERVAEIATEVLGDQPRSVGKKLNAWDEAMNRSIEQQSMQMEVAMPMFNLGFKCEYPGSGEAAIRQEMVGDLAAEALFGESSELYLKLYELVKKGDLQTALELQNDCCRVIYKMCSAHGNMYAVIKECLRKLGGPDCGSVRAPLAELIEADAVVVDEAVAMIQAALAKYC